MSENASGGGEILLGRITYDMMVSWWPTPQAMETMPVVAERMNHLPKVVFSRTMERATWNNTRLVRDDIVAEVRSMKKKPGPDMVIATIAACGSVRVSADPLCAPKVPRYD